MNLRKNILTIGGFDPCGGAGVLADIKTFEQHQLYGMAINTANTVQNDVRFNSVNWLDEELILNQLDVLLQNYSFEYVKLGLIPSFSLINRLHAKFKTQMPKFIWDPILTASAGFDMNHDCSEMENILRKVHFITPNWEEIKILSKEVDAVVGAEKLAKYCYVYLKGGHNSNDIGTDYLFAKDKQWSFKSNGNRHSEKHGSGCVLSSALTANLALNYTIHSACLRAKVYVSTFLESNNTLLGYHKKFS
jgi:hydroxymethylpyrimidine/phosphomethylpyrimidine kinase